MKNNTKPMKAIDFQNKMEGKMQRHDEHITKAFDSQSKIEGKMKKYDEHLMKALNRITKQENSLKDLKEDTGKVPWWQVILFIVVATSIMVVTSVLG